MDAAAKTAREQASGKAGQTCKVDNKPIRQGATLLRVDLSIETDCTTACDGSLKTEL
jgi:hypothetical protein